LAQEARPLQEDLVCLAMLYHQGNKRIRRQELITGLPLRELRRFLLLLLALGAGPAVSLVAAVGLAIKTILPLFPETLTQLWLEQ
jgi:hypothetical protein